MLRSKTGTGPVGPDAAAGGFARSDWSVGRLEAVAWSGTGAELLETAGVEARAALFDAAAVEAGAALLDAAGVDVTAPPQAQIPSNARLKSGHKRRAAVLASGRSIGFIIGFT